MQSVCDHEKIKSHNANKNPKNLPAFDILRDEGVMVMSSQLAEKQDIRPLR